jgi:hypothetical protein
LPRNGLRIGLRGCFLVQPALQDEPRRSKRVLGPSLAEIRQKTGPKSEFRIANEPLSTPKSHTSKYMGPTCVRVQIYPRPGCNYPGPGHSQVLCRSWTAWLCIAWPYRVSSLLPDPKTGPGVAQWTLWVRQSARMLLRTGAAHRNTKPLKPTEVGGQNVLLSFDRASNTPQ